MKASTQPTTSYLRFHKITVGEILETLATAPKDALVRFKDGGYLEASENDAWKEFEIVPPLVPGISTKEIQTCWF